MDAPAETRAIVRQLLAAGLVDKLHLLVTRSPFGRVFGCSTKGSRGSRSAAASRDGGAVSSQRAAMMGP